MATSMQEYLKRYASELDKPKKKKKKKKKEDNTVKGKRGLTIVDADPTWQKDIKEASSESEGEQGDAPLVIEDVEFKRMQRLEALRMRPYLATAADGSGWVSLNGTSNQEETNRFAKSPSQKEHAQSVSPQRSGANSPESSPQRTWKNVDLSPPRRRQKSLKSGRHDSPESSPSRTRKNVDLSPPRRKQTSLKSGLRDSLESCPARTGKTVDLSPPRRKQTSLRSGRQYSPELSPSRTGKYVDLSPPRRKQTSLRSGRHDSPDSSAPRTSENLDLSPLRKQISSNKGRHDSSESSPSRAGKNQDLSPPRRKLTSARTGQHDSLESSPPRIGKSLVWSPPRRSQMPLRMVGHDEDDTDLSPKRKINQDDSNPRVPQKVKRKEIMADGTAAGLQSGQQQAKEMEKKKRDDSTRLKEVEVSISGRHANTVYRDKHGKRLEGVDEILKLQQPEEPKREEKPLEWGRGLVQKREAEVRYAELEAEKSKPFARTRDDPDLDKALKEKIRWGDPMAHLVKKKIDEPVLVDLGASELMKESGFIVPQAIPKHSWLKRGVAAPPNRYGIKPGRHWDGVDRSTGYERDMFRRQNEREAERTEAYLWSVADM